MGSPVRIGAVAYLNTKPLVHGLVHGLGGDRIELSFDVPAGLARGMAAGQYDVALLPVVELGRLPGLEIVPGLGITTSGPARSVLLVSRAPVDEVATVALDPESRTSNALTKLLFAERWRREPVFLPGSGDLDADLDHCDAAVRIGDKALFQPVPEGARVEDLGAAWTEWTGLPFVWAAWAARPGVVDRELYRLLHESRRRGARALDEIAAGYEWQGVRAPELCRLYLAEHIRHRLGAAEMQAVRQFLAGAARVGEIDEAPPVRLALDRRTACHEAAEEARR